MTLPIQIRLMDLIKRRKNIWISSQLVGIDEKRNEWEKQRDRRRKNIADDNNETTKIKFKLHGDNAETTKHNKNDPGVFCRS